MIGNKVKIVAEIGINHNGDLETAKKLIDLAKLAGCDYVKFQKRTIDRVYSQEELDTYRESPWGTTTRQQKLGLEFGRKQYNYIDDYCRSIRFPWFASPWDIESVDFLNTYDIPYMKVASACVTNMELLKAIAKTDKEVIISTGMSTSLEITDCMRYLWDIRKCTAREGVAARGWRYILACTSTYPTSDNEINLSFIKTLKAMFDYNDNYKVGFSNHSPGIQYAIASVVLGAEMVEFHITLDRAMYGSDQAASIEPGGVFKLVKHIRNISEKAMGDGAWAVYPSEEKIKEKLRRCK